MGPRYTVDDRRIALPQLDPALAAVSVRAQAPRARRDGHRGAAGVRPGQYLAAPAARAGSPVPEAVALVHTRVRGDQCPGPPARRGRLAPERRVRQVPSPLALLRTGIQEDTGEAGFTAAA